MSCTTGHVWSRKTSVFGNVPYIADGEYCDCGQATWPHMFPAQTIGGLSLQEITTLKATLDNTRRERDLLLCWLLRAYPRIEPYWSTKEEVETVLKSLGVRPGGDIAKSLLARPFCYSVADMKVKWEGGDAS